MYEILKKNEMIFVNESNTSHALLFSTVCRKYLRYRHYCSLSWTSTTSEETPLWFACWCWNQHCRSVPGSWQRYHYFLQFQVVQSKSKDCVIYFETRVKFKKGKRKIGNNFCYIFRKKEFWETNDVWQLPLLEQNENWSS